MGKRLIVLILVILLVIGITLFFIFRGNECTPPIITTPPTTAEINDEISFETEFEGDAYHWDFGDGESSSDQKTTHSFTKAGTYNITFYLDENTDCKANVQIVINAPNVSADNIISEPTIESPKTVRVSDIVKFKDITPGATKWTWMFGESGEVDSKEQNPSYIFKNAGKFEILVSNDVSKNATKVKIEVLPLKIIDKKTGAERKAPEIPKSILINKLQSIANGDIKGMSFFRTLLCNEQIPIKINGSKTRQWVDYCQAISIEEDKTIVDMVVIKNPQTNCISSMEITQKTK